MQRSSETQTCLKVRDTQQLQDPDPSDKTRSNMFQGVNGSRQVEMKHLRAERQSEPRLLDKILTEDTEKRFLKEVSMKSLYVKKKCNKEELTHKCVETVTK